MGTQQLGLQDVSHGRRPSRSRLLAPLGYLRIFHPEKMQYDFVVPGIFAACAWAAYALLDPRPALFGDAGLLRFVRDLLVMAVPFMIGSLATVAMGYPGKHLDRRPVGSELFLDGRPLTMRGFLCYLLGYLSFLGLITLGLAVAAELVRPAIVNLLADAPQLRTAAREGGALGLFVLLSSLAVTVFWSLYFLTDVVNRHTDAPD